jgi:Uncharacterised nucleotidyltransferase
MWLEGEDACHPTREQELLLRAAVLQGMAALEAWREWRALVEIEALDRASLRLLPQLYRNLVQHGVADPWLGKLKGIYRYAWSRNQLMLGATAGVLAAFRAAGIETLILKGVALSALHYRDRGARPMDDIDVLVPWRHAASAMRLLEGCGWAPCVAGPAAVHIAYRHALGFRTPKGGELDLHWNVLLESCHPGAAASFWRAAVPLEVAGISTKALCPADQLLHVCVHGTRWSSPPPIRWIADAMMVLHSAGDTLDWNRLVEEAARRRLGVTAERALAYLVARLEAPVPVDVLARLRAMPRWRFERLEYHAKSRPRAARLLGDLPVVLFHFLRLTEGASLGRRLVVLNDYLRYRWGVESPLQVPLRAIAKASRRLVRVPLGRIAEAARALRGEPARRLG